MTAPFKGARVAVRCDASTQIGGGHLMRCLALADALSEAGANVTFLAAAMPDALADRVRRAGHALELIPAAAGLMREGPDWEEPALSENEQRADAEATAAAVGDAEWLVVDHYLLHSRWHSAARSFARSILVIDDLANRPYDCDVLLDQTFGRTAGDYAGRVPEGARVLASTTYALLRPEFDRERPAALARRQAGGPVGRILVSMGTADPDGITARIVEQVLAAAPSCAVDVVLGPQGESFGHVRALAASNPRISVHVDTDRMAELMRDADLAIGAAGSTSWERCCLGLPAIVLAMAENQRLAAENLERAGAIMLANSGETAGSHLRRLLPDERSIATMAAAAAALVDGQGSRRVVEAMSSPGSATAPSVTLRPAGPEDSRSVWLWRNDFVTRQSSQQSAPIPWADHAAWWKRTRESADRELVIAEVAHAPVAALRFDRFQEGGFEVSINLAPSARHAGLGGRVLAEACKIFRQQHGDVPLFATIHHTNAASRRIFEKLGFQRTGALSDSGFDSYVSRKEPVE